VNINLEKYVINELNFMSNLFILIYLGGAGREVHDMSGGGGGQYKKVF
jgi:hypothetical protein